MDEEKSNRRQQDVHSTVVRAGKRTYFFDIKATRNNDLYLSLTESKKIFNDGKPTYQKHKVFLYKEDFEKFSDALATSIDKIKELKQEEPYRDEASSTSNEDNVSGYSSVDFDDLS